MAIGDISMFSMLKTRMRWLDQRQSVLAANVANAATPGYRGKDMRPLDFPALLKGTTGVTPVATAPGHVLTASADKFGTARKPGFETTPNGNAVVLEDEMLKVAQNQADFQAASALYQRGLGLIKTAIGRRS